jgi:dihydrofolate reductase
MLHFDVIAACDLNGSIGKDACLPWYLPEDLKHFRDLTTIHDDCAGQNVVIMGRKTWESLPNGKLPNRINIVISRIAYIPGIQVCKTLNDALKYIEKIKVIVDKVFVIGGGRLYREAILHPRIGNVYLTIIHDMIPDCDTKFPLKLLTDLCREDNSAYSGVQVSKTGIVYSFHTWIRHGRGFIALSERAVPSS